MPRRLPLIAMVLAAVAGGVWACASAGSAFDGAGPNGSTNMDAGTAGPPASGSPSGPALDGKGVILVHAAGTPAFRLCFENELDRPPQPDSELMPQANVVGVEQGSAVRIGPLGGAPGHVYLFQESLIRANANATCKALLSNPDIDALKVDVGVVTNDLSRGVHLIVVWGCQANTTVLTYEASECGASWKPDAGNLTVTDVHLGGYRRNVPDTLPVQVMNLSAALESARVGADAGSPSRIVVTYGPTGASDGGAPDASDTAVVQNLALLNDPQPASPIDLPLNGTDAGIYASTGFRVALSPVTGDADAGAATIVAEQSLADIQRLSAPRDLPMTYYATASNYVLLVLGTPNPKLRDGGPDTDELRRVHLLAVPVIEPEDAGADAGADAGDAGP